MYRVRDHDMKYTRKVTKEADGYLSCNCRNFDGYGCVEGTSNSNNGILAIQGANGQVNDK